MFASVSSWILSIAGIICLSVLVELVLPDGQMNRYIKGIFSFIVVFIIISPLPKLLNKNIDISSIFSYEQSFQLDEEYLYQLNLDKLNSLQSAIEKEIKTNGYENVALYINADIFNNEMQIKSVSVDLTQLVILENAEHRDIVKIKNHITTIVKKHIDIDEEMIMYDG
ncbi:MAG: stage III sporulation protein AF [Clostridia bacterium]|nr:stage III sporulation protein AF [Clostridia bacterium]